MLTLGNYQMEDSEKRLTPPPKGADDIPIRRDVLKGGGGRGRFVRKPIPHTPTLCLTTHTRACTVVFRLN